MYRAATFAENTKRTYNSQISSYLVFCDKMGCPPVPASPEFVSEYAAYLARRLTVSSIHQYLNVVRLLHLESNFDNPCSNNWLLKSTLLGIKRIKGAPIRRKAPVTPSLLMCMYKYLDFTSIVHSMFWAGALVMFFGTFRKSNLFPEVPVRFSCHKQFVRSDFIACDDGTILLNVKYSKTIQFKQCSYRVKLFKCSHMLCPVTAVLHAFSLCSLPGKAPAFVVNSSGAPMCSRMFNTLFKILVQKCGKSPSEYSSHSFRRGSATWALQCGIPGEVIQQMGDWKSSCYKQYLDQVPTLVHDHYRKVFINCLP